MSIIILTAMHMNNAINTNITHPALTLDVQLERAQEYCDQSGYSASTIEIQQQHKTNKGKDQKQNLELVIIT